MIKTHQYTRKIYSLLLLPKVARKHKDKNMRYLRNFIDFIDETNDRYWELLPIFYLQNMLSIIQIITVQPC